MNHDTTPTRRGGILTNARPRVLAIRPESGETPGDAVARARRMARETGMTVIVFSRGRMAGGRATMPAAA